MFLRRVCRNGEELLKNQEERPGDAGQALPCELPAPQPRLRPPGGCRRGCDVTVETLPLVFTAGLMVKKSASDVSISSGTHGQYSVLQSAKLLPGAPQQPPSARMGISKPYNVKQIKTTNAQEAEAAIRCLLEARGGAPEAALTAVAVRDQGSSRPEPTPAPAKPDTSQAPPLLPRRPPPRVPAIKKPTLRRTGKPLSPEEQLDQEAVRFTVGPPETSLEAPPPGTAPRVPPVPRPRTFQPGRAAERPPSGGKPAPGTGGPVAGNTLLSPPEVPSLVPKVPPRRKKSAPAAFHLQVLQSSSQLLQGLTSDASGHDHDRDRPPGRQPEADALFPQVHFLGLSSATSPETDGSEVTKPEAASLLGEYQDPFWNLLHHPKLLNNAWISKSSGLWNSEARSPERADPGPELLPHQDQNASGHWVAISDRDKRTTLQAFDPLAET